MWRGEKQKSQVGSRGRQITVGAPRKGDTGNTYTYKGYGGLRHVQNGVPRSSAPRTGLLVLVDLGRLFRVTIKGLSCTLLMGLLHPSRFVLVIYLRVAD